MSRLKDIPALQRDGKNLNAVMQAVQEVIQTFRGYRGDRLDKALTLRDFTLAGQRGLLGGGAIDVGIIGGTTPGLSDGDTYVIDPTPPPTPTGLEVDAAITSLFVSSDAALYTQGHGHAITVVYGAKWPTDDLTQPTFSEAVELFRYQGTFSAYTSDPATRWCIWIKWQSVDGVLSTDPAGGTNGVVTTTGQDVSLMVEAMTGPGNPFTVLAVDTVIDGVTYPAGIYSTNAFLLNLQVTNAKIAALAVDDAKIASLSAAKITAGTLDAERIATGSLDAKIANIDAAVITSGFIGAARINSASIANASIDTAQIGSGFINAARINTASIANASINTAQIASATIGAAQIASGFIDAARINSASIANAEIGTAQIADAAITSAKIGDAQITNAKIGDLAVNTANIAGNAVTASNSSGGASTASTSISVPAGQTMKIICLAYSASLNAGGTPSFAGVNGLFNGASYAVNSYTTYNDGSTYWNDATTWVGYASVTGPATVSASANGKDVTITLMGTMR